MPHDPEKYTPLGITDVDMTCNVKVAILKNSTDVTGYLTDSGYSMVGVTFLPTDDLQYRVKFELTGAGLNSLLLATPIFDDITIYYQSATVQYLSYNIVK
jgi:hypothetical protein